MSLSTIIAKLVGKSLRVMISFFNLGEGKTAPGLICLKIDPLFVAHTQRNLKTKIIITGTNGKTTTTSLISHLFSKSGINYISNNSGSNLLRGIASSSLQITKDTQTVLWEADEAAVSQITAQVLPHYLLFTNLFRDQLDRYGEIDSILLSWEKLVASLPSLSLILNADDPALASLGLKQTKHRVIYFGLNYNSSTKITDDSADAIFCPLCHRPLQYQNITYSHLGDYHCLCDFKRPKVDFEASQINLTSNNQLSFLVKKLSNHQTKTQLSDQSGKQSELRLTHHSRLKHFRVPLTGIYNVYNCLRAITLAQELKIDPHLIKNELASFQPAFGRQEIFKLKQKQLQILLVKNPAGFNQVINTLNSIKKKLTVCIAINDRIADGKDVSWLWDVDFNKLKSSVNKIIITGDRTLGLAVRLKYANFKPPQYLLETDKAKALKILLSQKQTQLYLLPTYTALWEMRRILNKI